MFLVGQTSGCDAMHCRCDLVFCYKCGGVLKPTAQLKQCECHGMAPYLQAHEGQANINNPAFGGGGGPLAPAALARLWPNGPPIAALQAAMHGVGNGGGGGGGGVPPGRGRGRRRR